MRYIGPFFRMNKLSQKEITGQLFHLSKEAVRTLVLESKCGLVDSLKNYTKTSSSIDINTIGNISPLLCMYRKSSPNYIHNKNYNGFDEDSFKRDILPITNALMTINILQLSTYYSKFRDIDEKLYSYSLIYNQLAKEQLNFYSANLRSTEGVFVQKKNLSENNSRNFTLSDKDTKFKFSDQAFMMVAYNLYSVLFKDEDISLEYQSFALEILQVLMEYKEKIYELPFEEILKILLATNLFFADSGNSDAQNLIIDLTDFLINKFDEKDYYVDSLDNVALFALVLMYSYQNTLILSFKEKAKQIITKLTSLYDEEKELYLKLSSRKEIRYSAFDLTFYFLALNNYSTLFNEVNDYRDILSSLYRKCFINSGIITCWPEAPTLDDPERYRNLSLIADDMLDEIFFRMPTMSTPATLGIAPIFNKHVTYSKKRESFSSSISSFDSYRNMLIYSLIIDLFKEPVMKELNISDEFQEVEVEEDTVNDQNINLYESIDNFIPNNFINNNSISNGTLNDTFIPNETFNNSSIPNGTLNDTFVPNQTFNNSSIPNETFNDTFIPNETFNNSSIPNGTFNDTFTPNETFNNSSIPNGTFNDTFTPNETFNNSSISNGTVNDTFTPNENFNNSSIPNGTFNDTFIPNETFNNSSISNGTFNDTFIPNETFNNSSISNGTVNDTFIPNETFNNSSISNGTFNDTFIPNETVNNSSISNGTVNDTFIPNQIVNDNSTPNNLISYKTTDDLFENELKIHNNFEDSTDLNFNLSPIKENLDFYNIIDNKLEEEISLNQESAEELLDNEIEDEAKLEEEIFNENEYIDKQKLDKQLELDKLEEEDEPNLDFRFY